MTSILLDRHIREVCGLKLWLFKAYNWTWYKILGKGIKLVPSKNPLCWCVKTTPAKTLYENSFGGWWLQALAYQSRWRCDGAPRLEFCVLNFLSILLGFLSRKKLSQKGKKSKAEQFPKLQFLNDKIDQNTNFAKLQSYKGLFLYKFTNPLQLLSFWSQLYLSVS